MKTIGAIVAAAALICTTQVQAEPTVYLTGNTYRQLTPAARAYYLEGQIDGFIYSAYSFNNKALAESLSACTVGVSVAQWVAIVEKQLERSPEHWDMNASAFVFAGIEEACNKRGFPLKGVNF